jgi:hypothetical protein
VCSGRKEEEKEGDWQRKWSGER